MLKHIRTSPLLLLFLTSLACDGRATKSDNLPRHTGGAGADTGGDTGEGPQLPDLTPSECGESWEYLPLSEMGGLITTERDPALSLSAATLQILLAGEGYGDLLTPLYDVEVYRVRYQTQDRGQLAEATGLVAIPKGAGSVPILNWGHGTSGFTDECAPSAQGLEGGAFAVLFASTGMAVAAPDYLGMNGFGEPAPTLHPYIVPEPTAIASLDNIRALLRLSAGEDFGSQPDPTRVVHWGASEGGFAALWSDRYQTSYAPEFQTVATLAAVPPTDITGLARLGATELGATSMGLAGVLFGNDLWHGFGALDTVLIPEIAAAVPEELAASCSDFPTLESVPSLEALFTPECLAAAQSEDWSALPNFECALNEANLVGTRIPRGHAAPVFIVTGEADSLVQAAPTRDSVPELCAEGYQIQYMECAGAEHVDAAANTLLIQWSWLQARLAGEPLDTAETCVVPAPVDCPDL